ncbi:MAG TPA: hypothetical protein VIY68_07030 [Steroidobacteraceae bacterium]
MVPETELVPEIRKTGHRLADLAVAFIRISNPGAGAARVERFSILVDDKPVKDISEALLRLAGLPDNTPPASAVLGPIMYAGVAPSYIKAGSDQMVLRWPRTASNSSVRDKDAAAASARVKFEACYCSIFDECWIENSHTFRPAAVTSCG